MGIAKKHSEMFAGAGMRNIVPILLAIGSALLGAMLLWMELESRDTLPDYLLWPAIVGVVFCVLDFLACIAAFIAIRSGEGYHSKNSQKAAHELRRKHVIQGWGLKYVVTVVGLGMFITVGSYLYMALWVVVGSTTEDYCLTFTSGKCGGSTGYIIALVFGLLLLACVNVAMEGVVAAVEQRFDEKKQLHADGHYDGGKGGNYDYQDDPAPSYRSSGRGGAGW
ncbi:hypothetical protein BCR35DRAFT_327495 [Leucosporidium creatinivorum]|uniref:Uncharacterized protein n=1 Tax=Leucosporidium creatinivorum TaxID=106004 RepID=A0A1Y2BVZ4_9BASI|nr:hypothetical protein BCR35DRAFT_327495 [Leucosporidium creatinivorum]